MTVSQQAALRRMVAEVKANDGPQEHLYTAIAAARMCEVGFRAYAGGREGGAIKFGIDFLRKLEAIPHTDFFRAAVHAGLMAEYATLGMVEEALNHGMAALPAFEAEPNFPFAWGNCLHDLGALFVHRGQPEGIRLVEEAIKVFEQQPDGQAKVQNARNTLNTLKAEIESSRNQGSAWQRFFGRR